MKHVVVSGYYAKPDRPGLPWFHQLWAANIYRYAKPMPKRVFIISSASQHPSPSFFEWIVMQGDVGGLYDVMEGRKASYLTGWPATQMLGAWLAYLDEADLMVVEQDALVFGPWVERIYADLGQKQCVFGSNQIFGAANSLYLVRHSFIPEFVQQYLATGPTCDGPGLDENKFSHMARAWPEHYARLSFGVDRDRPLPFDKPVWYAQKFTPDELRECERRGLLSCNGMPDMAGDAQITNYKHP